MNKEFENYLDVGDELKPDAEIAINDFIKNPNMSNKRKLVRTLVAFIEGHSNTLRSVAAVGLECKPAPPFSKNELAAIKRSRNLALKERIKFTLSAIYKVFPEQIERMSVHPPNFGTDNWANACEALDWRNKIVHPKTLADLKVAGESWERIHDGLVWLMKQHFDFLGYLHKWNIKNSVQ